MSEIFACVYHGNLSFTDAYNLPVHRRRWWIERVNEAHGQAAEDTEKASEAQQQAMRQYSQQRQRQQRQETQRQRRQR